jgi:hypothetical protein
VAKGEATENVIAVWAARRQKSRRLTGDIGTSSFHRDCPASKTDEEAVANHAALQRLQVSLLCKPIHVVLNWAGV